MPACPAVPCLPRWPLTVLLPEASIVCRCRKLLGYRPGCPCRRSPTPVRLPLQLPHSPLSSRPPLDPQRISGGSFLEATFSGQEATGSKKNLLTRFCPRLNSQKSIFSPMIQHSHQSAAASPMPTSEAAGEDPESLTGNGLVVWPSWLILPLYRHLHPAKASSSWPPFIIHNH